MKYEELHDGRKVPVIGMGTARIGSGDAEKYEAAVRAALDMGYTHIDTAEVYGDGLSETVIGRVIQDRDRASLFITSKVSKSHLRREQVLKAIEGSLERLGTDYLDLYLIHAPDPAVPLEETMEAMNQLVETGKTRYIGVSNFSVEQMEEAYRLTSSIVATNQVHYSLLHRAPEQNGVLQYCQEKDVLLTAYSPLEVGKLANHDEVQEMAQRLGTTAPTLALAWLIQKPKVIAIPLSTSEEHLREDMRAVELELSAQDIETLDKMTV
jgi:diketogulonate reductase-like aldo/keto reductase